MISNRFHKQSGFTLLELLVTIGIVGILTGIAAPSVQDSMNNARLTANYNELRGALNYARAQAIRLGDNVHLTARIPSDWTSGFVVYVDANGNDKWDKFINAKIKGEELRLWKPMHGNMTLRVDNNSTEITFNPEGLAETDGTGSNSGEFFYLCDTRLGANNKARELQLLTSGLVAGAKSSDCGN